MVKQPLKDLTKSGKADQPFFGQVFEEPSHYFFSEGGKGIMPDERVSLETKNPVIPPAVGVV